MDIRTVILSNFRRTRTVPNSNFLLKIHWEHSTYRTIVLLLKTTKDRGNHCL